MSYPLSKHWHTASPITAEAERTLNQFPKILRQILYNRGFTTKQDAISFLEAQVPTGCEPENLNGIPEAIDRIHYAIKNHEKIAIYGDYDVDGVTATALLVDFLKKSGGDVIGYIPNRFEEGYGLNTEAITGLRGQGINLILTVDCGIRSVREAEHARKSGVDLIITDHHHPGTELPTAFTIINPKMPGSNYPDINLAGVGLAYKLALAYTSSKNPSDGEPIYAEEYLDLVALGTVADLAPLTGENRSLVRAGLSHIQRPHRQGILSLIGVSGLKPEQVTANSIGFILGPRLNAAGRLDSALAALDLLLTKDVKKAGELAQILNIQNHERQQKTRVIQEKAEILAFREKEEPLLLFAVDADFNPGLIGLAASRLQDRYYRPAIVAHKGEEFTRGSCRSIPEFHITDALDQCADILIHHGGHTSAAGFTIHNNNLEELIERLNLITEQQLGKLELRPSLYADSEIPLSELKPDLLKYLEWLEPTGYGNHQALFITRDLKVIRRRTLGKDESHLKLTVTDGRITYDAIGFRQGYWADILPEKVDLIYNFEKNEFNDRQYLQLNVRDIKPAGNK
jgi:single-stranded-DNA-specific exonuclease